MPDYSAYDIRNMAHARLLTAAPDLLAVCEELVDSEQYWGEDFDLSFIVAKANPPRVWRLRVGYPQPHPAVGHCH